MNTLLLGIFLSETWITGRVNTALKAFGIKPLTSFWRWTTNRGSPSAFNQDVSLLFIASYNLGLRKTSVHPLPIPLIFSPLPSLSLYPWLQLSLGHGSTPALHVIDWWRREIIFEIKMFSISLNSRCLGRKFQNSWNVFLLITSNISTCHRGKVKTNAQSSLCRSPEQQKCKRAKDLYTSLTWTP